MSSNAQQIPTISSSVGVKPNEVELTIIQHERKHRIYLITIVLLVVTSLLLIAAIAAIVVTFLVDKPAKQASNNTIVDSPIFSSSNCSYGFSGSYCDECGVTFAAPNVKIVGGIAATRNSWPAHAVVIFTFKSDVFLADKQVTYKLDRTYLCGGTLINRRTILTAAHCIQKTIEFEYQSETYTVNVTPNNYFPTIESMFSVYLGVDQFGKNSSGVKFSVSYIKRHDDYNVNSNLNDIAIIQLSSEAKLSQSIQVACLPSPEKGLYPTTSGMDVWAMGFGALNSDGPSPDTLYNVKMTLYDGATQCRRVAPRTPKNWDSQICAGELKGGKDTCQGDSGGAIYVKDEVNNSTKYIAVGITSYGVGCALPNSPGIYTRISYYLNWINQYS